MKNTTIGLFGFGVVGEGVYQVLKNKPNLQANIKHIVIKDIHKKRNAPAHLFSNDKNRIFNDPEIDLVVELIDDADAAYLLVKKALNSGRSVVSANKKMIASHGEELILLAKSQGVSFLYEASVCGSVPVIRNLEEYFDQDLLTHITGIVNGSTNYILTQMDQHNESYSSALKSAQQKGFAESDPTLDVEGLDALFKLQIMVLHAFGCIIPQNAILRRGIASVTNSDLKFAKEKGLVIKLLAKCDVDNNGKIQTLSVFPTFLDRSSTLATTHNEYNGVLVGSQLSDEQFLYGKGAGRYPTSSAVLSDISAYKYEYKYEYKKGLNHLSKKVQKDFKIYLSYKDPKINPTHLFSEINERYFGLDNSYIIGRISEEKLAELNALTEVSIILFSEAHKTQIYP